MGNETFLGNFTFYIKPGDIPDDALSILEGILYGYFEKVENSCIYQLKTEMYMFDIFNQMTEFDNLVILEIRCGDTKLQLRHSCFYHKDQIINNFKKYVKRNEIMWDYSKNINDSDDADICGCYLQHDINSIIKMLRKRKSDMIKRVLLYSKWLGDLDG